MFVKPLLVLFPLLFASLVFGDFRAPETAAGNSQVVNQMIKDFKAVLEVQVELSREFENSKTKCFSTADSPSSIEGLSFCEGEFLRLERLAKLAKIKLHSFGFNLKDAKYGNFQNVKASMDNKISQVEADTDNLLSASDEIAKVFAKRRYELLYQANLSFIKEAELEGKKQATCAHFDRSVASLQFEYNIFSVRNQTDYWLWQNLTNKAAAIKKVSEKLKDYCGLNNTAEIDTLVQSTQTILLAINKDDWIAKSCKKLNRAERKEFSSICIDKRLDNLYLISAFAKAVVK